MKTRYALRLRLVSADGVDRLITTPSFSVPERVYAEVTRLMSLEAARFDAVQGDGEAVRIAKCIRPPATEVEVVGVRNMS
ncbi:MAG: hypothetical protein UY72_C0074G0002 [Candidatus Uhrbacteria bacterium GW2011_GWD2_52_7]|uniref:Uncharacterized protein n=1 Tax=Candidatus Uhrbacteria bacterium GW2011_GWD2_52_7 TaxID=1618989 RepID=A0A0G1XBV4_9BACT|nr:MAG: hypothetical protein UY72_C0074G0002 [Candidatus Uhrbacteria bacterium GW2011_GWD2_52_7]